MTDIDQFNIKFGFGNLQSGLIMVDHYISLLNQYMIYMATRGLPCEPNFTQLDAFDKSLAPPKARPATPPATVTTGLTGNGNPIGDWGDVTTIR